MRLIVNALETNFFFYQSDLGILQVSHLHLEVQNNRFTKLLSLQPQVTEESSMKPSLEYQINDYEDESDDGDDSLHSNHQSMMNMNFPSISEAFKTGDGLSFGNFPHYSDSEISWIGQDPRRKINSMGDMLVTTRAAPDNFHNDTRSMKRLRQMLITRPICRVYYESNRQYGYYRKYKHLYHDRVFEFLNYIRNSIFRSFCQSHLII